MVMNIAMNARPNAYQWKLLMKDHAGQPKSHQLKMLKIAPAPRYTSRFAVAMESPMETLAWQGVQVLKLTVKDHAQKSHLPNLASAPCTTSRFAEAMERPMETHARQSVQVLTLTVKDHAQKSHLPLCVTVKRTQVTIVQRRLRLADAALRG